MQLFTLEDKSKVEISICAAHGGCNTKSTISFGGFETPGWHNRIWQRAAPLSGRKGTEPRALFPLKPSCGPRRSKFQSFGIVLRSVPQVNGAQRQELVLPRQPELGVLCYFTPLQTPAAPQPCLFVYTGPNEPHTWLELSMHRTTLERNKRMYKKL